MEAISRNPLDTQIANENTHSKLENAQHPLVPVLCLSFFPLLYFAGKMIMSWIG